MKRQQALGPLRAITIIISVVLATIAGAIPLIPAAVVKIALPAGPARRAAGQVVYWVSSTWARVTHTLIRRISGTRVIAAQEMADDPGGRYVLIANHQSWADIMLLIAAIYPQLPFPRFFIKEPLRWLPVIGLACWALDFPFMKRHSRAALEANPQLHAWWHVLASSGLYFLTLTTAFDAVRASGGTPVIRWWCGAVPWCDRKAQQE